MRLFWRRCWKYFPSARRHIFAHSRTFIVNRLIVSCSQDNQNCLTHYIWYSTDSEFADTLAFVLPPRNKSWGEWDLGRVLATSAVDSFSFFFIKDFAKMVQGCELRSPCIRDFFVLLRIEKATKHYLAVVWGSCHHAYKFDSTVNNERMN